MSDVALPRPAGSALEEALLEHVAEHVQLEKDILDSYAELADQTPDAYVRYLANLILEDEHRHHRVLMEMRNRVLSDVAWRDINPQVPRLTIPEERRRLLEETQRFIDNEEHDAVELRRLKRELRPIKDTSLLSLMVELMELDTQKHIKVLEFIKRSTKV